MSIVSRLQCYSVTEERKLPFLIYLSQGITSLETTNENKSRGNISEKRRHIYKPHYIYLT